MDQASNFLNPLLVMVVGGLFIAAWMMREYQYGLERDKLLDRLMARSLPEFRHEARKEELLKKKPEPRPFPSDEELAAWEHKHQSQVAETGAALESALAKMKRDVASSIEPQRAAGVSHGS